MDILWISSMGIVWIYYGYSMGIVWIYYGYSMGIVWITMDIIWE
jgi:hypothetical protein